MVAGAVSVAAFIGLCTALLKWLCPLTANHAFGRIEVTASKSDLLWSIAWISIIFILPAATTLPVFTCFELKPYWSIYTILFMSYVTLVLYPPVVTAIHGPGAEPLRSPTKDDEIRHAKRTEVGMFVYAYFVLYSLLAAVGVTFVVLISRLT